ncbi:hypothetical protein F5Y13DRAFT_169324 [Hypoxylon sp. FL1857]|nr:hypothetical protein F5Y13DRAFT_169324 [Hypoxylon sp. FL1857]
MLACFRTLVATNTLCMLTIICSPEMLNLPDLGRVSLSELSRVVDWVFQWYIAASPTSRGGGASKLGTVHVRAVCRWLHRQCR